MKAEIRKIQTDTDDDSAQMTQVSKAVVDQDEGTSVVDRNWKVDVGTDAERALKTEIWEKLVDKDEVRAKKTWIREEEAVMVEDTDKNIQITKIQVDMIHIQPPARETIPGNGESVGQGRR